MAMNDRQPLWSRTDFILADLIDATNAVAWLTANHDVARAQRSKYPDPYPRPGDKPKGYAVTAEKLLAFRERTRRG